MSEHQLRASWEEAMVHSICWQVQIRFPPTFRNISPVLLTTIASHIFHPNTVTSTNQVPSYFSKNLSVFFQTAVYGYLNHMSFTMELSFQVLTVTNNVTSHFHVVNAVDENINFPSENMNLQFCGSEAWYMPHSNLHSIYWQISPLLLLPQLPRSLFRLLILWSKWAQVSVGQNENFFSFAWWYCPTLMDYLIQQQQNKIFFIFCVD